MPQWLPPVGPGGYPTCYGSLTGCFTAVPCVVLPWTASHCPTGYTLHPHQALWDWPQVYPLVMLLHMLPWTVLARHAKQMTCTISLMRTLTTAERCCAQSKSSTVCEHAVLDI